MLEDSTSESAITNLLEVSHLDKYRCVSEACLDFPLDTAPFEYAVSAPLARSVRSSQHCRGLEVHIQLVTLASFQLCLTWMKMAVSSPTHHHAITSNSLLETYRSDSHTP